MRITNENKTLIWFGGTLEATKELSHEIYRGNIFQVRARHFPLMALVVVVVGVEWRNKEANETNEKTNEKLN